MSIKDEIRAIVKESIANQSQSLISHIGQVLSTDGAQATVSVDGMILTSRIPYPVLPGSQVVVLRTPDGNSVAIPVHTTPKTIFDPQHFFTGGSPARFALKGLGSVFQMANGNLAIILEDAMIGKLFYMNTGLSSADWGYVSTFGIAFTPNGLKMISCFRSISLGQYKIKVWELPSLLTSSSVLDEADKIYNIDSPTLLKEYTKTNPTPVVSATTECLEDLILGGTGSCQLTTTVEYGVQDVWLDEDGKLFWLEIEGSSQVGFDPITLPTDFPVSNGTWTKYHMYTMAQNETVPTLLGSMLGRYTFPGVDFATVPILTNRFLFIPSGIFDGTRGRVFGLAHPSQNVNQTPTESVITSNSYVVVIDGANPITDFTDTVFNPAGWYTRPNQAANFIFQEASISTVLKNACHTADFLTTIYKITTGSVIKVLLGSDASSTIDSYSISDPMPDGLSIDVDRFSNVLLSNENKYITDADKAFRKITNTSNPLSFSDVIEQVAPGQTWNGIRYASGDPQVIRIATLPSSLDLKMSATLIEP